MSFRNKVVVFSIQDKPLPKRNRRQTYSVNEKLMNPDPKATNQITTDSPDSKATKPSKSSRKQSLQRKVKSAPRKIREIQNIEATSDATDDVRDELLEQLQLLEGGAGITAASVIAEVTQEPAAAAVKFKKSAASKVQEEMTLDEFKKNIESVVLPTDTPKPKKKQSRVEKERTKTKTKTDSKIGEASKTGSLPVTGVGVKNRKTVVIKKAPAPSSPRPSSR